MDKLAYMWNLEDIIRQSIYLFKAMSMKAHCWEATNTGMLKCKVVCCWGWQVVKCLHRNQPLFSSAITSLLLYILTFERVCYVLGLLCKLYAHHGQHFAPWKVWFTQEGMSFSVHYLCRRGRREKLSAVFFCSCPKANWIWHGDNQFTCT